MHKALARRTSGAWDSPASHPLGVRVVHNGGVTKDDERRSVRIELEDGAAPAPNAPMVETDLGGADGPNGGGGSSTWAIVLAILIVGVVGAGVLTLRPAGDEAADGTERQAPTTTTDPQSATGAGEGVDDAGEQGIGEATEEALNAEPSIVATPLVTGASLSQVVAADIGYIALGQNGGAQPTVLRSVDGEDWFDVETTASIDGQLNAERLQWFNFLRFGDSLVVTGLAETPDVLPDRTVFVSDSGAEWVELDLVGSSGDGLLNFFPFNFVGDSVFGIQLGGSSIIDEFLSSTTTFEVPEAGVCDVIVRPEQPGEVRYEVIDCLGSSGEFVNLGDVRTELDGQDVLSCLDVLPSFFSAFGQTAVHYELL